MADSRRASSRHMKRIQKMVEFQSRFIHFLLSIIGAFLLTYLIRTPEFNPAQDYVLFLLFFSVGLWVTEAIPPFAVGILIVGFLVFFLGSFNETLSVQEEAINVKKFVSTWSNSVIWLILGGFFLAEGMRKTGVDQDVFRVLVSLFKPTPANILLSVMLATCLASMLMSNTATTAMMVATIAPIVKRLGGEAPFSKSLLLGIPIAAAVGGMGTIIGSPPNAIAVEAINNAGALPYNIGFLEWMIFGAPLAIILTILLWYALLKKYRPVERLYNLSELLGSSGSPKEDKDIDKDQKKEEEEDDISVPDEKKIRKRIVVITMAATLFLWLTGRVHGIPPAAVSGIPIIVFTMVSIITGDDVRTLPWDTLMLVAGGLSLGLAIQETKLSTFFVEQLQHLSISTILVIPTFALMTVIFSNIMSNTATATILIPIAALWPGIHPAVLPIIIGLAASCALFLPVSTPPNAIVFSTGLVKQQEFRFGGSLVGLAGPLLIIAWVWVVRLWWGF
jgi:sodium-dependent dicarboxylate transporter 2/3/5